MNEETSQWCEFKKYKIEVHDDIKVAKSEYNNMFKNCEGYSKWKWFKWGQ